MNISIIEKIVAATGCSLKDVSSSRPVISKGMTIVKIKRTKVKAIRSYKQYQTHHKNREHSISRSPSIITVSWFSFIFKVTMLCTQQYWYSSPYSYLYSRISYICIWISIFSHPRIPRKQLMISLHVQKRHCTAYLDFNEMEINGNKEME